MIILNSRLYLSIVLLFSFLGLSGQILNPVQWTFDQKQISDNEVELIFSASIEDGWNVYSQFLPEDSTPLPTMIEYDELSGAELLGKSQEFGKKKEGEDPIFKEFVIKFLSGEPYKITQKIKTSGEWSAKGYLTFMTCDDEKCLPPTDVDFEFGGSGKASKTNAPITTTSETTIKGNSKLLEPVSWTYALENVDQNDYKIILNADIEDGWNIYSYFNEDGGPLPTSVDFASEDEIQRISDPIEYGNKKAGYDDIFQMDVIKYLSGKPYKFEQDVTIDENSDRIKLYLDYMACDDEKCTAFNKDLIIDKNNLQIIEASQDVAASEASAVSGDQLDQLRPKLVETYDVPIGDCGTGDGKFKQGWFNIFLFGFIGGLFAILLPCIFPMIPITVSYFMKDTKRKGWVNGLIYGVSIIGIFVSIGLLVTAMLGPEALNQLSTNWIANTFFFLVFVAFAISFFGYFEITLPSSWSTKSDSMADKGGLIGTFFMAATLAIVSFSCTGPIIGTALVQVASQGNYWGPFAVMFGFSLALALPFGLFAAFPTWLNSLPRSGTWMNSLKVVLGFLELALALKFLSVADMTQHWGFLKYELFLFLWIVIFALIAAYLFGFIKFPHDSPIKKLSIPRVAFGIGALLLTAYLAMGFRVDDATNTYDTPGLTSGMTPPATYNFFLPQSELDAELTAKYPSIGKCANNITCFKDYFEALAYAKEVNKPLMLDFTGYGCVNCRKTEEHIWVDEDIRRLLNDEYILVSLYVDDRKKLDQTFYSKNTGRTIRNIGNKWADFQVVNFQQNSQPLYVLINSDEDVLAEPRGFRDGITAYEEYLECGIRTFSGENMLGSK